MERKKVNLKIIEDERDIQESLDSEEKETYKKDRGK